MQAYLIGLSIDLPLTLQCRIDPPAAFLNALSLAQAATCTCASQWWSNQMKSFCFNMISATWCVDKIIWQHTGRLSPNLEGILRGSVSPHVELPELSGQRWRSVNKCSKISLQTIERPCKAYVNGKIIAHYVMSFFGGPKKLKLKFRFFKVSLLPIGL